MVKMTGFEDLSFKDDGVALGVGVQSSEETDAAALLAQGFDLAFQVRARESAQTLELAWR